MKYATAILLAATIVNAQFDDSSDDSSSALGDSGDTYIADVCIPKNSTGYPDFDAPCNAVSALQLQCIYGEAYFEQFLNNYSGGYKLLKRQTSGSDGDSDGQDTPMQSNVTQRTCICESQFWNQAQGCASCFQAHGFDAAEVGIDAKNIASLSSAYCAASTTPTAGLADFLFDYSNSIAGSSSLPTASSSFTFSDPIGNKTAVSLYFTPSVTGSAAYIVAQETGSSSDARLNTASGQIRPTASVNNAAAKSGSSGKSASSTESGSGAVRTEVAAAAGVLGIAGLVALL